MRKIKEIFFSLPSGVQKFLTPKIVHIIKLVFAISGRQLLDNPIGGVDVPFAAKPLLKKSFAQQGEDLILDRILSGVLKKDLFGNHTYVDVGGYDPVRHSVTYLLYLRGWNGVVFDPSVATTRLFRQWRKRDNVVNAVVGKTDNVDVDFYVKRSGAITQIGDQSPQGTKYPSLTDAKKFERHTFRQVNLNDELKRQGITKIEFLNIDVEGAELEILKTFNFQYFKPSVIAVEIHGNDIEECLKSEMAQIILSNGYQAVGSAVITQFFARKDEIF